MNGLDERAGPAHGRSSRADRVRTRALNQGSNRRLTPATASAAANRGSRSVRIASRLPFIEYGGHVDRPELRKKCAEPDPTENTLCGENENRFAGSRDALGRARHGGASGARTGVRAGGVALEYPRRPVVQHRIENGNAKSFGIRPRGCANVDPELVDCGDERISAMERGEVPVGDSGRCLDDAGLGEDANALRFVKLIPELVRHPLATAAEPEIPLVGDLADDVSRLIERARHHSAWATAACAL